MKSALRNLSRTAYRLLKRGAIALDRPRLLRKMPALASIDPRKPVYLFFAPEAIVQPHYAAHLIIARTLKERGHQVLLVRCSGVYPHCVAMDMHRLDIEKTEEQRKQVCQNCDTSWLRAASSYRLPSIDLAALLDARTRADIHAAVATMPADAGKFEFDGFRFGALCGSDLALTRKTLNQMQATGAARQQLEAYVEGALLAYRAMQVLFQLYSVARVSYFNEYSMLLGAAIAARRAGVPVTRLSHAVYRNIDRSKIMLAEEPLAIYTYHRLLEEWPRWRNLALPPGTVSGIGDSALMRLSEHGHTVYSTSHTGAADEIFEQMRLSRKRYTLVAYTSSMDEYHSNMNLMGALGHVLFPGDQPFESQTAWLQALIDYVENSGHLQLVVRIHPREGRSGRENHQSDNLIVLRQEFSRDYAHVRVVWPEDKTSSYDLADMADLAVTGWSNISLELARLGIPVLTAFERYVPFPIGDVVEWASTPAAYFAKLEAMLNSGPNFEHVRYAYRWSNVYSLSLSLDFSDLIPRPDFDTLPPYRLPKVAKQVEDIMVRGMSVTEINRMTLENNQTPHAWAEEAAALRRELRRVIWFLAAGEDRSTDYVLAVGDAVRGAALTVAMDGDAVVLTMAQGCSRRHSRIIARLAVLAQETSAPAAAVFA